MKNLDAQIIMDWPYDDAIEWMRHAADFVNNQPEKILVACGSHKETVITLGRNCSLETYEKVRDIDDCIIRQTDRGGGITAHEPGQIVLYPVLHIRRQGIAVKPFINMLEESMIEFLRLLGIEASRSPVGHGVFVDKAKIGFLGLRINDHITSHGLAINVLNSAGIFSAFDPCGLRNQSVTAARYLKPLEASLYCYSQLLLRCFNRCLFLNLPGAQ